MTQVFYKLLTSGLPKGKTFSVWRRRLGESPVLSVAGLYVNEAGKLVTSDGTVVEDSGMGVGYMVKGLSFDLALVSTDLEIAAYASATPFPLEAKGPDRCRLSIELLSKKGDTFFVRGEGFEPNEEIDTTSQSGSEIMKSRTKVSAGGTFMTVLFPTVVGKTTGLASYIAIGQKCNVKVEYKWGAGAMVPQ